MCEWQFYINVQAIRETNLSVFIFVFSFWIISSQELKTSVDTMDTITGKTSMTFLTCLICYFLLSGKSQRKSFLVVVKKLHFSFMVLLILLHYVFRIPLQIPNREHTQLIN